MSKWTEQEVTEVEQKVIERATKDADFRKLCLDNPNEAIKEISGKDLPEGLKIRFEETGEYHHVIVLPEMVESELSEDDMDNVAGGAQTQPYPKWY